MKIIFYVALSFAVSVTVILSIGCNSESHNPFGKITLERKQLIEAQLECLKAVLADEKMKSDVFRVRVTEFSNLHSNYLSLIVSDSNSLIGIPSDTEFSLSINASPITANLFVILETKEEMLSNQGKISAGNQTFELLEDRGYKPNCSQNNICQFIEDEVMTELYRSVQLRYEKHKLLFDDAKEVF